MNYTYLCCLSSVVVSVFLFLSNAQCGCSHGPLLNNLLDELGSLLGNNSRSLTLTSSSWCYTINLLKSTSFHTLVKNLSLLRLSRTPSLGTRSHHGLCFIPVLFGCCNRSITLTGSYLALPYWISFQETLMCLVLCRVAVH